MHKLNVSPIKVILGCPAYQICDVTKLILYRHLATCKKWESEVFFVCVYKDTSIKPLHLHQIFQNFAHNIFQRQSFADVLQLVVFKNFAIFTGKSLCSTRNHGHEIMKQLKTLV